MRKRLFKIVFIFALSIIIFLHIYPLLFGNFFFTIDQGSDALYIREIFNRGKVFLHGPETSIRGVYTGPLWYYFSTIGYLLTRGNPVGGVLILVLLNLLTSLYLFKWLSRKVGNGTAFLTLISLNFFWNFFYTSLWSFNPFALVSITIFLLILLANFIAKNNKRYYYYSLIPIILAFNVELAGACALFILFLLIGIWGYLNKKLKLKELLSYSIIIPALPIILLIKQFIGLFLKTKIISYSSSGLGVFSGTNFKLISIEFIKIIGQTAIPQSTVLGILVFIVCMAIFFYNKKINSSLKYFILLTFLLMVISFLFFASNKGWRSWQTVYLPPVLFLSLILIISAIKNKYKYLLLTLIIGSNLIYFSESYINYLKPSNNPSVFYNEIKAIDWIYQNSENDGFSAYNYTDSFYDKPYQYLFWWYGLNKYKYLPYEYSNFPLSHKELYVPGFENYLEPKKQGLRTKFLIIQSETNGETNRDWITKFRSYHDLILTTTIGSIRLEKYYLKKDAPNDYCIWWGSCN